jgi:hypothetical protein
MEPLISILIAVLIFAVIAYGAFYICDRAGFPLPVRWIIGVILLLVLLYYVAGLHLVRFR